MKWKAYPEYKDSGVEWLGEVPSHWETRPLKYIAQFVNGAPFRPGDWLHEGVPIIRIENLNGGEAFNYTNLAVETRYHVCEGDLLFGWSGNRGTSFGPFIWKRPGLHYLNQHIFRVANYRLDKAYLYWVLKALTHQVEKQAHGIIGMVHITKEELGTLATPFISIAELRAIAAFLDRETARIDAMIAKKERLIALLEEKRTALISQAVTKGLDGLLPEVAPSVWQEVRTGRVIKLQRGYDITEAAYGQGDIPVISSGGPSGWAENAMVRGPGVVIGRKGTLGTVWYMDGDYWPHDTTLYVREFRGSLPRFVFYFLKHMCLERLDVGAANPTLNRNHVHPLQVRWPDPQAQSAIATFLDHETAHIDVVVSKQRTLIEKLREYRTALVSAAVTGKIDVRDGAMI